MEILRPWGLILYIPLVYIIYLYIINNEWELSLKKWTPNASEQQPNLLKAILNYSPILDLIGIGILIYAMSGPGKKREFLPDETKGIDIMIALDVSGSMVQGRDFFPKNRLEVSLDLLQSFVEKRKEDRLGLVIFAGAAYLQSPLTSDRDALKEILSSIDPKLVEEEGTAIGDAILLSTYRLKNSKAKSKVILIITDGVSNVGKLDPETATLAAKSYGVKLYSIGIGKEDNEYEVNFEFLDKIAKQTNGVFFRAENLSEFTEVLSSIDRLEKEILNSKPKQQVQTNYDKYIYLSLIFLGISLLLKVSKNRYFL
jgi:Ca-activated chloride channel family protein